MDGLLLERFGFGTVFFFGGLVWGSFFLRFGFGESLFWFK